MSARAAFLCAAGLAAALLSGELYVAMRENAADEEVRKLNGIGEGEGWLVNGAFTDPPGTRSVELGPLANPGEFFTADDEFARRLLPNLRARPARLRRGGATLFDVTYSTNRFGWRATPQVPNAAADVLFFGDAFGTGLNDADTLPARFSAAFQGAALAHNLGVPGWGVTAALRALELGVEKPELMQGRVTKVFYVASEEQLAVGPGLPLYDGAAVFTGHAADPLAPRLCAFSSLCGWLVGARRAPVLLTPREFAVLVARMGDIVKQRYNAGLTVVSWNPPGTQGPMGDVEKELAALHVDLVSSRTVTPDPPGARSNALLGSYLAQRLGK